MNEKSLNHSSMSTSAPYLLTSSLFLPILFIFYIIYTPTLFQLSSLNINDEVHDRTPTNALNQSHNNEECDLFIKGRWIWNKEGSLYTNFSCTTIPYYKNCFLHGRSDSDFLNWRWKPDQCELPRFDAKAFLSYVQGKTIAFIGDSLARNQMESLLCLLSSEETPKQLFKDDEDRFTTWHFPVHNFTLKAFWSQFLVKATEIIVNGSSTGGFNLHLDQIDERWSTSLPTIDYAILSDANWFFRKNYMYEDGKLIGCVYCQTPNVTHFLPDYTIRKAFRAAFDHINSCKNCSGTRPFTEGEANDKANEVDAVNYRKVQVEEIEKARKEGEKWGNKFEVLDITKAMLMRPDGHPGLYYGDKWKNGYKDCVRWCLPGPVDTFNELLFYMLRNQLHHKKSPTNLY
ncbi:hypothetical protein LIER_37224 [Lithospermum erythrorhizon]|uniref:Trichome birefringence-like N-terminal domain-containing protein n=1 Tax=Lithospermum erythrorhizon TaxID=34254 RepID=A0AAV3PM60_LITER